jgi:hypothetical protein
LPFADQSFDYDQHWRLEHLWMPVGVQNAARVASGGMAAVILPNSYLVDIILGSLALATVSASTAGRFARSRMVDFGKRWTACDQGYKCNFVSRVRRPIGSGTAPA